MGLGLGEVYWELLLVRGFVLGMGGLYWGKTVVGGGRGMVLGLYWGSHNRLGRLEWEWEWNWDGGHSWGCMRWSRGCSRGSLGCTGRCRWGPPAPGRPQHCSTVSHGWGGHACDEGGSRM